MDSSSISTLVMRLLRLAALAVLLAVGSTVAGSAAGFADEAPPTMSISPGAAAASETITVSVAGWPEGSATVSVCGNEARRGEDDCDGNGARSIDVVADGSGAASLVVAPPVDCPCVVRVAADQATLVQT